MLASGRFLYRAMFSHLMVAVPPAVVLGMLVIDVNEAALKSEVQALHLSVVNQMRLTISNEVDLKIAALDHAERILNISERTIAERQVMLKALVAGGRISYLALYTPEGRFDSLISSGGAQVSRAPLSKGLIEEAKARGWAFSNVDFESGEGRARLLVPWTLDKKVFGFVVSTFELSALSKLAEKMAEEFLGASGQLDIIAGDGVFVASSVSGRVSHPAGSKSPFNGHMGQKRKGLTEIEAGSALIYVDERDERRFGTIISAPELRLVIGGSRSEAVALASLVQVKKRAVLLSAIAALAAGLIGLLLARGVSNPLGALARGVQRSAASNFSEKVKVVGYAELKRLGHTFNEVIGELERHRKELRSETQMRVRLARFLSPTALHQLLSAEHAQERAVSCECSIVYADICASSELSHRVTEKQLVSILGEFFSEACGSIERSGGAIDRYSGDAIIGVFASGEVEDHQRAAFNAAAAVLRISKEVSDRWQGQIRVEINASVGLVTGQGSLMQHGAGDVSVAGGLVERAATLQATARAGTVLIDEGTKSALADHLSGGTTPRPGPTLNDQKVFQVEVGSE